MISSLAPYDPAAHGGWTRRDATHLLWRLGFGASREEIDRATKDGLSATIERLIPLDGDDAPKESDEFESTEKLLRQSAVDTSSIDQLKAWWLYRMRYSQHPLLEKVSLFWHNHFATSYAKVQSVDHMLAQNELIRTHALGSFRQLLHGMTRDVAMLIWLDSNSNRKRQANENYAREVMELFSLGVGNYTEKDIQEAARAFTGWHVRDDEFWFNRIQHDFDEKTVFGKTSKFDGDEIIELCLEHDACPKFLAVKLLRTFCTPQPSDELVNNFAARIRHHNYAMAPAMRDLFLSEAFFSAETRHVIIKSPLDLVLGAYRSLGVRPNLANTVRVLAGLTQDVFMPPTVKGWEGGRLWVNSATMLQRMNFVATLCSGDSLGNLQDETTRNLGRRSEQAVELLLARKLPEEVLAGIKEQAGRSGGALDRGRKTIHAVMSLPEFQLT